jgi:hypothetical protein
MNDIVSLIANLALTLSLIVAVIFGIAQVKAAAQDRRERLTLDSLRHFQTHEFSELMHFIISNRSFPSSEKGFQKLRAKDQVTLLHFAQEMESLGLLVAENLIDLDLVDKTLGSFVTTSWSKYKPMFKDIREKQSDPFLGEYFQWLAERIEERMKKHPRRPFYDT